MAASEIRIKVPHPSSELLNNMLGVVGLVAIVLSVGLLAGWAWALGLAGVFAVALSLVGATYAAPVAKSAPAEPTTPSVAAVAAVSRSA